MPVKEWFRKLQPVQLYLILFFTSAFFIVEIVASYVTHSLTLLLNAYHMLCNIIALIGCIASIKYRKKDHSSANNTSPNSSEGSMVYVEDNENGSAQSLQNEKELQSERRMKNTFGWARIDVLTMLVCCVFLTSFCFSLLVEALQTLVHIDHLDEMHHPLPVLCIGASGILLNAFCYIIIGGYTFNQGVFLHITSSGEVILKRSKSSRTINESDPQDAIESNNPLSLSKTQGLSGMCRDVLGCILVMIASIIVYFTEASIAKFIDPICAIISAILLLLLSLPYLKESGLILLQTIPNHINIDSLKKEILESFPGIVNVHDLHVWQLTEQKVISTVHIIFLDPTVYASIIDPLKAFFIEMGITQVTIQPEFHKMKSKMLKDDCLIRCQGGKCRLSQCCSKDSNSDDTASIKCSNSEENTPSASETDIKKCEIEKSANLSFNTVNNLSFEDTSSEMNVSFSKTDDCTVSCQQICSVTVEFDKEKQFNT